MTNIISEKIITDYWELETKFTSALSVLYDNTDNVISMLNEEKKLQFL